MGIEDWLEKKKKALAEKLKQAADPQAQKDAKKEAVKKTTERTLQAIKLAKRGLDKYNEVAKKVDEVTTDATKKGIELAEQAKPIAEKIDEAASALVDKAKNALNGAAEKVKKDNVSKPSTGSGILDLLSPAVPETDATKPKPSKNEPPKPA